MFSLLVALEGLAAFALIAMAAARVGSWFTRWKLPLITGFLVTGALAGPSLLGLIPAEMLPRLRLVDQVALAFIGFAAGGELHVRALRGKLRAIAVTTGTSVVVTMLAGTVAAYFVFARLPQIADLGTTGRLAVAALAGSILVARSPSSAIAIVRELRARGPFTSTTLGVTVVVDVAVIVAFSGAAATADAVLHGGGLRPITGLILAMELLLAIALGWVIGRLLALIVAFRWPARLKTVAILAAGGGMFLLADFVRHQSPGVLGFELLLEPLFVAMVAGVVVANLTDQRREFGKLLHDAGPTVYLIFFTLTGATLDLRVLAGGLGVAGVLVVVRLVAIFAGSWLGGTLAGNPGRHNRHAWAAYVTQAGVGLGLAKEVAGEFPGWGETFAAMLIGVIVVNQLIGPPLHKWAIRRLGESHLPAERKDFSGTRDALIFGMASHSQALARQLASHGWKVRIASRRADESVRDPGASGVEIVAIRDLDLECLRRLEAQEAEAVVTLLSDEENLHLCELLYEHFGTPNVVVHLHDRDNTELFRELGATPVESSTSFVGLLDHMVRSPAATSMILGLDTEQDVQEIEIRSSDLAGRALRDLDLPLDTLVLAVVRERRHVVSHGYTRLELGDHLSVMGDPASLEDVRRKLEGLAV